MRRALRIAVADEEARLGDYYREALGRLGHEVVAVVRGAEELAEVCRQARPDLIIANVPLADLAGVEVACADARERPVPVVLVSAQTGPYPAGLFQQTNVFASLRKPIREADLEAAIALAVCRFGQFQELRQEAAELKQALADRKVIERAKGVLMRRAGLTEPEAFRRLQRLARDRNLKLAAAEAVLVAEDALQPPAGEGD